MPRISLPLSVIAILFICLVHTAPAQAQASRTWVSGVGDDANPCSRTASCKTFAGAISKTATNGEIDCLDPGGFGDVTITKSITIDCHETLGSILNAGSNAITIAFDSFAATDIRLTVRLRGLTLNGFDSGVTGIHIIGGTPPIARTGGVVIVEDTVIDGNFGGVGRGISDDRTNGGELYISNTTVRNTANSGIVISGSALSSQRIDATLQNVRIQNSGCGLAISNGAKVFVANSTFTGNATCGIYADGPINLSQLNVDNSVSSNNGVGVDAVAGGTIVLSNDDIAFNTTGITGATQSYTNNRISGNGTPGTAPTPIGPLSTNPSGQQ